MSEFSTISGIFGRRAWTVVKEMRGVEVFLGDADYRSCFMILGGQEYKITRVHHHKWHVVSTGHQLTFGSQRELLAWIEDRL